MNEGGSESAGEQLSPRRQLLLTVALMVVAAFVVIDKNLIQALLEPIAAEFKLDDFSIGLVVGPAYAVLYLLMALPLANLAEKWSRRGVVLGTLAFWSAMTTLCGTAGSFFQLFLARMGVGAGVAGARPASLSLIADSFPPHRQATVLSTQTVGSTLGSVTAGVAGGWIGQEYGWRTAFVVVGVAGMLVALVLMPIVREPRRQESKTRDQPSLWQSIRALFSDKRYVHLVGAAAAGLVLAQGVSPYFTSFFVRSYDMPLAQAASIMGVASGIFGSLGALAAGFGADRLARRNPPAMAWFPCVAIGLVMPCFAIGFMAPVLWLSIAGISLGAMMLAAYGGPLFALVQQLSPPGMRAQAAAIVLMASSIMGFIVGTPATGALSDFLAGRILEAQGIDAKTCFDHATAACKAARADGLRQALAIWSGLGLWAVYHFASIARLIGRERQATENA